jgi:hypothetical protein
MDPENGMDNPKDQVGGPKMQEAEEDESSTIEPLDRSGSSLLQGTELVL